jgi:hypothetical protein
LAPDVCFYKNIHLIRADVFLACGLKIIGIRMKIICDEVETFEGWFMNEANGATERLYSSQGRKGSRKARGTNETGRKTSRLAIAAVVCAFLPILAIFVVPHASVLHTRTGGWLVAIGCVLLSLLAFLLAIISLVVIAIRRNKVKGWTWSVTSLLVLCPIGLALGGSLLISLRRYEQQVVNMSVENLCLLGRETIRYTKDNGGQLPRADEWCDLLLRQNPSLSRDDFRHPRADWLELKGECHFAFNKKLSGLQVADIPNDVVLIYEADGDWNLNGGAGLLKRGAATRIRVGIFFTGGDVGNYWFYRNGVRKRDLPGRRAQYESIRWEP